MTRSPRLLGASRTHTRRIAALLAFLATLAASPAAAGLLRGTLAFGHSPASARARPRDVVVWLEEVPEKTEHQLTRTPFRWFWRRRTPPTLPRIVERDLHYQPRVTALATGSVLLLRNQDRVWHGTFSVSPARAFDLGKRAPGRVDTLRFDSTGVVALRCDIHPEMSAFVIVTPNHAFTRPDANGGWVLPELPAGHYTLHAWHPDLGELHHAVDVPAHGEVNVPLRW